MKFKKKNVLQLTFALELFYYYLNFDNLFELTKINKQK